MNSGLTSHHQLRFKVSSNRPEKQGINLAIPGLVVYRVIHYTTTAPCLDKNGYEKWKVKEPGVFYLLFYAQSPEILGKLDAGVAHK